MRKIIVVAKSLNRVIGKDNDLVWDLPADIRHYHSLVKGGWALMGRRTFESDYGVLPIEKTIVVTRQSDYFSAEAHVVHSLKAGIEWAEAQGKDKLFILGGGQIYKLAMDIADEIVATEVHGEFDGDTFFPKISMNDWAISAKKTHLADAQHSHTFDIVFYKRTQKGT